jgi:hypothetical protein
MNQKISILQLYTGSPTALNNLFELDTWLTYDEAHSLLTWDSNGVALWELDFPRPVTGRQIPPTHRRAQHIKDGLDHQSVILGRSASPPMNLTA